MDNLLKTRADALATRGLVESSESGVQYLVFTLADERYACPLSQLTGIIKLGRVTQVPDSDPILVGLINKRGEVRPLYDLRQLLGQVRSDITSAYALMVRLAKREVAMRVTDVVDLVAVSQESIQVSPGKYSTGRIDSGVTLLDLEALDEHPLFREEE